LEVGQLNGGGHADEESRGQNVEGREAHFVAVLV
jgi:hypothetical protein